MAEQVNKVLGSEKGYLLVQRNKETQEELAVNYNEYNGMFDPNYNLKYATKFEDVATVQELAGVQNQIARLLKQKYEYLVVKETVERTVVEQQEEETNGK